MRADTGAKASRQRRGGHALQRTLDGTAVAVSAGLQELFGNDLLARMTDDSRGTVEIILAEALNNIVEHAYASHGGQIEVSITPGDGYLFIRLVDEGLPMPGNEAPGGKLTAATEVADLPEGGFGWYLIRSLSQDLIYARDGGQNVLSFCVGVDFQA